jgi:DNA-binding NarL/FixJ family response regulator
MAKILSVRQKKIAQMVGEGLTNECIALKLRIAQQTVKNHLAEVYARTQRGKGFLNPDYNERVLLARAVWRNEI